MAKKKSAPVFRGGELIKAASGLSRDILSVVLQPDQFYTEAEAVALTNRFLGREVKQHGRR